MQTKDHVRGPEIETYQACPWSGEGWPEEEGGQDSMMIGPDGERMSLWWCGVV